MSLEHGPAPRDSNTIDILGLIVALAPVAMKLIEIAGPQITALIDTIHAAPEEHKSVLRTTLADARSRLTAVT